MNNSFEFVSRCTLNNSASKETHQFGKASRFRPVRPPPYSFHSYSCSQSAYDLANTTSFNVRKKDSVVARDYRFKSSATIAPSPNAYRHRSFADLSLAEDRGKSFGKAPKLPNRNKNAYFPGPGAHEPIYNPEKNLSYTMRGKVNRPDHRPVFL